MISYWLKITARNWISWKLPENQIIKLKIRIKYFFTCITVRPFQYGCRFVWIVGLDTRLTSCYAHDGSQNSQQELLDSDGCSLDTSILPNVLERSPRLGIKLLYANFHVFKFPDRDHLHFKCTVVVCKTKCPLVSSARPFFLVFWLITPLNMQLKFQNTCNLIRRKSREAVKVVGTVGTLTPLNIRSSKVATNNQSVSNNRFENRGTDSNATLTIATGASIPDKHAWKI